MTPLDAAIAAMQAAPEDADARLRFWSRFAQTELFLALRDPAPARGPIARLEPQLFALGAGPTALAFDSEARLAGFGAGPHFAGLSGRALARMMAGQGVALGLNLGDASAGTMLPPEALDWLAGTLSTAAPQEVTGLPVSVTPPDGLPERLLAALDDRIPAMAGLAASACLVGAAWDDGARRPLILFIDVLPGAEAALAEAVGEAVILSGLEAGDLDVGFARAGDALAARVAPAALRLTFPAQPPQTARPAPGSDPDRPPRLR